MSQSESGKHAAAPPSIGKARPLSLERFCDTSVLLPAVRHAFPETTTPCCALPKDDDARDDADMVTDIEDHATLCQLIVTCELSGGSFIRRLRFARKGLFLLLLLLHRLPIR